MIYQQGDVVLARIDALPKDCKKVTGNVLHQGDNHAHTLSGTFKLQKLGDDIFLEVKKECVMEHQEHGECDKKFRTLPSGIYKKSIVMEYDHWLEESRHVID